MFLVVRFHFVVSIVDVYLISEIICLLFFIFKRSNKMKRLLELNNKISSIFKKKSLKNVVCLSSPPRRQMVFLTWLR